MAVAQAQIQVLMERGVEIETGRIGGAANTEVAKPPIFDGTSSKILGFVMMYKLYIKMKLREVIVEEQI